MKTKWFAIGIILLFLTIGFSSIINAADNTVHKTIDGTPIIVLEYKADGTVERTVVRMTSEQEDSYHEEMRNAQDLDTRLSIDKKYSLISQDVTVDSLREGMEKRAEEMGLTQNGLMSQFRKNESLLPPFVRRNVFCYVDGGEAVWDGFCIPPITGFTGWARHLGLFFFIVGSSVETLGLLGTFYLDDCLFVKLIGFVGIIRIGTHNTWRAIGYEGFCVYMKALGTPD